MSHFVITGPNGGVSPRLEINDFVNQEQQFSLYIQALQRMYTKGTQDDLKSFFQVAGIHGLPYIEWDGSAGKPFDPNVQWGGYCTHGSVLFPTWHRPYVLLYEQILHDYAKDIAKSYTTNKDNWLKAADALRQPYWDWAQNSVPPPEVISLKTVTITTPSGRKAVDNPLLHYKFHPIDPSFPDEYQSWQTTLRHPTSSGSDATDNVSELISVLENSQVDVTTKTYNLLTRVRSWPAFSNHTPGDGGSTSNSLEAIHDGIHNDVGAGGHMSDPAVAGFDPIFFLHHCNVDRLLSLWSAIHPNVWVSKGDSEDGTFTLPPDATVDQNSALTPFWNTQNTFWASAGVNDTGKLGYIYPEFQGLDMGNANAVQRAIAQKVNQLYGNQVFTTLNAQLAGSNAVTDETQKAAAADETNINNQFAEGQGNIGQATFLVTQPPTVARDDGNFWEWTARIESKKYELGTSYSIILFLGEVPQDPRQWRTSPNFVGAHHAFVNSAAGICANCRNQTNILIEGFVHLNNAIAKHSSLNSFEPDVIVPYLTHNLHWRVIKMDGTAAELQSLEVTVIATPVSLPPGAMFPVAGDPHRHNGITYGRPGGSRHA